MLACNRTLVIGGLGRLVAYGRRQVFWCRHSLIIKHICWCSASDTSVGCCYCFQSSMAMVVIKPLWLYCDAFLYCWFLSVWSLYQFCAESWRIFLLRGLLIVVVPRVGCILIIVSVGWLWLIWLYISIFYEYSVYIYFGTALRLRFIISSRCKRLSISSTVVTCCTWIGS